MSIDQKAILEADSMLLDSTKKMETLYLEIKDAVYTYALSIVKNPTIAEDVMQDVFVKVIEKSYSLRNSGSLKSWIMAICRNTSLNTFAHTRRTVELDDDTTKAIYGVEDEVVGNCYFESMLKSLTDIQREIVVLHLLLGFKHYQIAYITGMPYSSVRRCYSHALKKLRQTISL